VSIRVNGDELSCATVCSSVKYNKKMIKTLQYFYNSFCYPITLFKIYKYTLELHQETVTMETRHRHTIYTMER